MKYYYNTEAIKQYGEEEEPECDHQWHYIEDWEGDPTLHNGVNDLSHWECELCGATCDKDTFPIGDYLDSRWGDDD